MRKPVGTAKAVKKPDPSMTATTMRLSNDTLAAVNQLADEHQVSGADIFRFLVEAGLEVASRDGLGEVMDLRRHWLVRCKG